MKKIVFFTNRMTQGGSERVISYLANGLSSEYAVDIVTMTCAKSDYFLCESVQHVPMETKMENNNHSLFANIKRVVNLKKYIGMNKDSIFISFVTLPSYILLLFYSQIKGKVIVTIRNDPKEQHKHLYDRILVKILYPKADALVFQTKTAEAYYQKIQIKKSCILPNPINERFVKKPYMDTRDKTIVSVGRLIEQKNQKLLISAFAAIANEFPDFKLVIYGEGYLRDSLQKQISELGLCSRIKLAGMVSNLEDKVYIASLFVLSSDFEGMPNALLEAMALGVPVISTDCSGGGPRSIIENGTNGVLVPCRDEEALADSMRLILSDKKYARSIAEQAHLSSNKLSPEIIIEKWKNFVNSV